MVTLLQSSKRLKSPFREKECHSKRGKKNQDTLSVKTSVEANAVAQQNEVEVFIFM